MKAREKLIKIDPSSIPVLHSKRLKKNAQPRLVTLYCANCWPTIGAPIKYHRYLPDHQPFPLTRQTLPGLYRIQLLALPFNRQRLEDTGKLQKTCVDTVGQVRFPLPELVAPRSV